MVSPRPQHARRGGTLLRCSAVLVVLCTGAAAQTWSEHIRAADELWPPRPELIGALERWLHEAAELRASAGDDDWIDARQEEVARHLISPLGVDREHGWSVPRRLAFAYDLQEWSKPESAHTRRWKDALPAIRTAYPALAFEAIPGIVPIGPDPVSGLFEFWHAQSGAEPKRDDYGRLQLEEKCGLVLVLLPGGTTTIGAQDTDPEQPHYDLAARPNETLRNVTLSPFMISKFELTQAQWKRLFDSNPSYFGPDGLYEKGWNPTGAEPSGLEPLEGASWRECRLAARMCGLELPTEAQWEYAARAGTTTPWWTGSDRATLFGAANLIDESARRAGADFRTLDEWPDLDDGWAVHAPIGTFTPNAFGLHEIAGNLFEYCRDGFGPVHELPQEDPVAAVAAGRRIVVRGGSWHYPASLARSSFRGSKPTDRDQRGRTSNNIGLRPVLELR